LSGQVLQLVELGKNPLHPVDLLGEVVAVVLESCELAPERVGPVLPIAEVVLGGGKLLLLALDVGP